MTEAGRNPSLARGSCVRTTRRSPSLGMFDGLRETYGAENVLLAPHGAFEVNGRALLQYTHMAP